MAKGWRIATLEEASMVAKGIKSLTFSLPDWEPSVPGQHYDIRLTAEDGYQAERSYSVASAPERKGVVEFGIELLENGEVSPYLFSLKPGDQVEMRGPIGGSFIWNTDMPGPLCLVGGGSGMVPLMAMLRHRQEHLADEIKKGRHAVFLASVKDQDHLLYYDELRAISAADPNFTLVITFTQSAPPNWDGFRRRIDHAMLQNVFGGIAGDMPMVYVCGPTPFAENAASNLVEVGFNPHAIRIERFGGGGTVVGPEIKEERS
ncbi:MAG TPA: FAD-binding oxidoreductase [Candidatus Paceibacterota bacterium]|nr:FAD-binding oxidoreductase [Candidatus Paceibacterota bacterium]